MNTIKTKTLMRQRGSWVKALPFYPFGITSEKFTSCSMLSLSEANTSTLLYIDY